VTTRQRDLSSVLLLAALFGCGTARVYEQPEADVRPVNAAVASSAPLAGGPSLTGAPAKTAVTWSSAAKPPADAIVAHDGTLVGVGGAPVTLAGLWKKQTTLVVFYRGFF
jgi:hypothetical protein